MRSGWAPGVTQNIVKNPNSVLQDALQSSLQGTTMKSRTFLHVATNQSIVKAGGGTANAAFLATSGNPPGGNAKATQAEATFWIETIAGTGGQPDKHQLQYTQLVMLDSTASTGRTSPSARWSSSRPPTPTASPEPGDGG